MQRLPSELLELVATWANAPELKRLGLVSRAWRVCAVRRARSLEHGGILGEAALQHIRDTIAAEHTECCRGVNLAEVMKRHMNTAGYPLLKERVGRPARILTFLYAYALHTPKWPLAPYALEWCALNEGGMPGSDLEPGAPRAEVLALLRPPAEALEILRRLAAGVPAAASFVATATAACQTACPATVLAVQATIDTFARAVAATGAQYVPLATAIHAAATAACPPVVGGSLLRVFPYSRLRAAAFVRRAPDLDSRAGRWLATIGYGPDTAAQIDSMTKMICVNFWFNTGSG